MLAVLIVIILLGSALLLFFVIKAENKMKKQIIEAENSLQREGFIISKKVGNQNFLNGGAGASGYYLYVDDVNKKWFMTSYYSHKIDKIRRYDDLLEYDFFDKDVKIDIEEATIKTMTTSFGAVSGLALGGVLGHGILGGVAGIGTGLKATDSFYKGKTSAYGLVIKTKDCDINNPELIFDFCNVIRHSRLEKAGKTGNIIEKIGGMVFGLSRSSRKYKRDIATITEIAKAFDYIKRSNML